MGGPLPSEIDSAAAKSRRGLVLSGILVFLLAAVPIVLTPFPPTTDLPQHISQILLAREHAGDSAGPYIVLWGAPNTLVYGFIFLLERVFSLAFLGRAILLFLTAAWVASIFYAAARKNRPPETAVLVSLFLFNISFYWGFLNFLVGFPVFVAWFFLTIRKEPYPPLRWYILLTLTSFLLYGSHVLWLAAGAVWFGLISLLRRLPFRSLVLRAAALGPVCLLAFFWYQKFSAYQAASKLDEGPEWSTPPFEKFFSLWFKDSGFGGGAGIVDTILFFFILAWAVFAVVSRRKQFRKLADHELLIAAAFIAAICFFAPDIIRNTIYFSGRWAAVFLIFLFLGLPAPRTKPVVRRTAAWAAVIVFFFVTTLRWVGYDRNEMEGFRESLAAIPRSAKLLGLDLAKSSRYFRYRPFLQTYAYAHVFRGAELGLSFAKHSTGLVAYREPPNYPWTPKLDWYSERVRDSDLKHFDYVLVNGTRYDHIRRIPKLGLIPVTPEARWRLYRVAKTGQE